MATELTEGTRAPDLTFPAFDGSEISLASPAGRTVVLYFYPKDDTPGCTREACDFRDNLGALQKLGVIVYGVSRDDSASHQKFARKYELNFPLISDNEGTLVNEFGVWKEKTLYGRKSMGIERTTFLIDGEGVIRRIWRKVRVEGHVDEVMEAVRALR